MAPMSAVISSLGEISSAATAEIAPDSPQMIM